MEFKLKENTYRRHLSGILMLIGGFLSFTVSDTMSKLVSERYDVFEIVTLMGATFALCISIKAMASGGLKLLRTSKPNLLIARGLINFLHIAACYYAFSHMPVMNVYSILFFSPVLVTLLASFLLKERVGWQKWFAVCAGFCGILIMLRPGLMPLDTALWVTLMTPITCTLLIIMMQYAAKTETNESILFYAGVIMTVCGSFAVHSRFIWPPMGDLVIFFLIGATIAIAWSLVLEGFKRATVAVGAPFQYTQLIWATLFGWLIWGTLPDFWRFAGMAVVVGSGLFTLWHEAGLERNRKAA